MTLNDILTPLLPYVGTILTYILWRKTVGASEKKAHQECFDKLQHSITDHDLKIMTGAQLHEKLADKTEDRFKHFEGEVNTFKQVVPEVQALKLKMEHYTVKIDNLIESVKESKTETKDALREIRDLFSNMSKSA